MPADRRSSAGSTRNATSTSTTRSHTSPRPPTRPLSSCTAASADGGYASVAHPGRAGSGLGDRLPRWLLIVERAGGRAGRGDRTGMPRLSYRRAARRRRPVTAGPGRYRPAQPHRVPEPREHDEPGGEGADTEVAGRHRDGKRGGHQRNHENQWHDPAAVHQPVVADPGYHPHRPAPRPPV